MDKKGDDAKATTNPFVWIIFSHPFAVILLISLLTFVLPLVLLSIYPLLLGNDPEKVVIDQLFKWKQKHLLSHQGFETDGTPYSGPRLAWALLQVEMMERKSIVLAGHCARQSRQFCCSNRPRNANKTFLGRRIGRLIWQCCLLWWANPGQWVFLFYCQPFVSLLVSFLSQFVVEVPSIEDVFSHQFLTQMCNLQQEMAQ